MFYFYTDEYVDYIGLSENSISLEDLKIVWKDWIVFDKIEYEIIPNTKKINALIDCLDNYLDVLLKKRKPFRKGIYFNFTKVQYHDVNLILNLHFDIERRINVLINILNTLSSCNEVNSIFRISYKEILSRDANTKFYNMIYPEP